MIHSIKRFAQKAAIKIIRLTDVEKQTMVHSEYETESFGICKNLINKKSTTLLISPISGKRYIKSDDNQLFIIIEPLQMTIVNHQYSYNINIEGKAYYRIAKLFDGEVEQRRELMEKEIRSNVKHSLSNIYNNLLNEKI
jgi:hypothetical protein